MRKITLMVMMMAIYAPSFSQTAAPCPASYKRNNGSSPSCPGALLTLNYDTCPTVAFSIDSIFQNGVKINDTYSAGTINCGASQFQITYCISPNNVGPAGSLTIYFHEFGSINGSVCVIAPAAGPLPVKLSSFFAKRNTNMVTLSWKTETEVNSKAFILERQTGNTFLTVATVPASGNSNGSSYSYIDNNINRGISQYRLKIVDQDGSYSYSDISAVKGISTTNDFTVFPNPSNGSAKVTISDISEPIDVQLVDISGRVIKNISLNSSNTVELNNLQKGMYMIRIVNKNSGESVTQKLTVIN